MPARRDRADLRHAVSLMRALMGSLGYPTHDDDISWMPRSLVAWCPTCRASYGRWVSSTD